MQAIATQLRYSGVSLGFQIGSALTGGLTPLVATWLVSASGSTAGVSLYLIALGLIGLWACAAAPRRAPG